MDLWGRKFTRRELEGYVGDMRQIADVRLATLDDGPERGVRVADVRTGGGLDFTVLLDRGMDIGTTIYNSLPIAWQSGTGAQHPARHEPIGTGWLRTFHGGLVCTCGLTSAGGVAATPIDPENGETLGLHGRISHIPAHDIRIERRWTDDDQWSIAISGTIDEISIFGYRLRLERTIEIVPGEPLLAIQERVRNMGGVPAPLMLLYHCNFGWPIVSPESEIFSPAWTVTPRDEAAQAGVNNWNRIDPPTPGYAEQVFFHDLKSGPDTDSQNGLLSAAILNRPLGLGVEMRFDPKTLPYLTEWKQMGFGDYTVGLEPGNCLPEGRVAARENKRLRMLAPGETESFTLAFRILTSRAEVDSYREASKHRVLLGVDQDTTHP